MSCCAAQFAQKLRNLPPDNNGGNRSIRAYYLKKFVCAQSRNTLRTQSGNVDVALPSKCVNWIVSQLGLSSDANAEQELGVGTLPWRTHALPARVADPDGRTDVTSVLQGHRADATSCA